MWKTAIGLMITMTVSGVMGGCATTQGQVYAAHSSVGSSQQSASFDFNRHIGWIHGRCLAIKRTELRPGMVVQVITVGLPQRGLKATVTGVATPDSGCLALLSDRMHINQKKGRVFYVLDLQEGANLMAVGLMDYGVELLDVNGTLRMDIDHDGKLETAVSCQTSEGIKFSLVPVDRNDATPVWSDYYYLGYDTKPTCRD
jgi:hypothetical protein